MGLAMTNLSSIHHARFTQLHDMTNNYNKATLLDKLIYWWQISTYTLDDDQIWFTRSIEQISNESKLSRRSVERYLKEFEAKGLIFKVNRLLMKKHLYIRISDKLLHLIGAKPSQMNNRTDAIKQHKEPNNLLPTIKAILDTPAAIEYEQDNKPELLTPTNQTYPNCIIINQDGVIDSANLAVSIYKDKDSNTNSTVSQVDIVNNSVFHQTTPNTVELPIEQTINELLTPKLKQYIKGMLTNLQTQHRLQFSNPTQLFAEVVFSVLNKQNQLTGIDDTHHRVNIIAKLLREKRWLTPKGFYNHWEIGARFKQTQADNDARYQHQKQQEMDEAGHLLQETVNTQTSMLHMQSKQPQISYTQKQLDREQKNKWRDIMINITTEERYLYQIQQQNHKNSSTLTQSLINTTMTKLDKLRSIKQQLEKGMDEKNVA
jgi:hypothetical protein